MEAGMRYDSYWMSLFVMSAMDFYRGDRLRGKGWGRDQEDC